MLGIALVLCVAWVHGPGKGNLNQAIRWFHDHVDLGLYASRGDWYPRGLRPYADVFSEYPQLATYFFALPHLLLGWLAPGYTPAGYELLFSLLMAFALLATLRLVHALLPERKGLAWLLLLPACLYFTLNRYDVLPAFLSLLAYYALVRGRPKTSAFLLALGVLAKWYLLVLFPVFAQYRYRRTRRWPLAMTAVFVATGAAAAATTVWHSGWNGLLVPYAFHLGRDMNGESLFYLLWQAGKQLFAFDLARPAVHAGLLVLQFSGALCSLLCRIDSEDKVVSWSALSILVFMLFAKFYSPQWVLWIMPFLLLASADKGILALAVALDLVSYLYFPVAFDLTGPVRRIAMPVVIGFKTGILLALGWLLARRAVLPAKGGPGPGTPKALAPGSFQTVHHREHREHRARKEMAGADLGPDSSSLFRLCGLCVLLRKNPKRVLSISRGGQRRAGPVVAHALCGERSEERSHSKPFDVPAGKRAG